MSAQAEPYKRDAPSVTVFLFAYNQSKYIRAACESVLAQDYTPLQIVFSDDCSTDDTFDIMTEIASNYQGHHQISLNRNAQNLGLIRHVNLSHQLTTTDLLVAAAGDDISEPNRVTEIVKTYRSAENKPFSIHSNITPINKDGKKIDFTLEPTKDYSTENLPKISLMMGLVIGATHAWSRDVFDKFGDITELDSYEDLIIAFRSALLGDVLYIDRNLVRYRVGSGMSTTSLKEKPSRKEASGQYTKSLELQVAVLTQRRIDCQKFKKDDLACIIGKQLKLVKLALNVYRPATSIWFVLLESIRSGIFLEAVKLYFRKKRKGW